MTASHASLHEPASVLSQGGDDDEVDDMDPGDSGPDGPYRPRWRVVSLLIAAFVVGALAVLAWYAYQWSAGPVMSGEVPLILAETTPEKIRPEDPGGLEVRHQDSLILNQADGDGVAGPVERLLPPPEMPLPPPRARQTTETAPPQAAAPAAEAPKPVPAPEPTAPATSTTPAPAPETAAAAPPAPQTETAAVATGFDLQLAALRSRDTADQEAARLQRVLSPLLGDHRIQIQDPRPGGQSPVYRLRIGPFADRGAAQSFCTQLKAKKQDCFVVKR